MAYIPPETQRLINEVRQVNWDALDDAIDKLGGKISARAKLAMQKIRKSGFSASVIRKETKKLTTYANNRTYMAVGEQIEAAALYAQRAADVIRAWEIAGKLTEDPNRWEKTHAGALKRAQRPGVAGVDAEATLARIRLSELRTPAQARKAMNEFGSTVKRHTYKGPATTGTKVMDRLRKARLVRKSPEIGLSERLHGAAAQNIRDTNRAVNTAIREAKSMDKAGRDLISAIRKGGDDLAVNQRLTKPLQKLRRSARELQLLSINKGDEDALKAATQAFDKDFAAIRKVLGKRVDSRSGYRELVQIIDRQGAKGTEKALNRWLDEKQRYQSERILETETNGAYRAREYEQHANKPYITGFWWRRSAAMIQIDRARKKDIFRVRRSRRAGRKTKRKKKGQPCRVCPQLADQFFPVEYAREFPRGAHPHCRCWYEWVYSKEGLKDQPITQADVDWYESLPD
jgi:hypothetical protein